MRPDAVDGITHDEDDLGVRHDRMRMRDCGFVEQRIGRRDVAGQALAGRRNQRRMPGIVARPHESQARAPQQFAIVAVGLPSSSRMRSRNVANRCEFGHRLSKW
jgi:hypothetical protein